MTSLELDRPATTALSEVETPAFQAIVYDEKTPEAWAKIKDPVVRLAKEAFGDDVDWDDVLNRGFNKEENTALVLTDRSGTVIGYTRAVPMSYRDTQLGRHMKNAYVCETVINESYRGRGLVGTLINGLETALIDKGYETIRRSARADNGYAASISRHYGAQGRIIWQEGPYFAGIGPNKERRTRFTIRLK